MKFLLVTFGILAAANAMYPPASKTAELQTPENRLIETIIQGLLEDLRNLIREQGFDPFQVDTYEDSCTVFDFVNVRVQIDNLNAAGITSLVLNGVDFTEAGIGLDLTLPQFEIDLGNIDASISVFGGVIDLNLEGNGTIAVYGLGVNAFIIADLNEGLDIQDVEIKISLDRIESNVVTVLNGQNYSSLVNELLNETVLDLLRVYGDQIEEVLDVVVLRIIRMVLEGMMDPFSMTRNIDIPLCEVIDFILNLIRQLDIL